jgi:pimeloyl-ACP methyl ester carboxylesterase
MDRVTHYKKEVRGLEWHWVETGEGDPVVLLHGIPESWRCWSHQMQALGKQFRVLAFDLKGYGQSDKREGDYSGSAVAAELIQVLDSLGIEKFRLGGHDWGVMIGDHICNRVPDRVEQYVRCCLSLHAYDPRNSLHHQWNSQNPEAASRLMRNADAYVRVWFDTSCKPETRPSEEEIRRIVEEFSYPGVAEAVPRYFRDVRRAEPVDYSRFTMPVLYVHGEHDPRQPIEYARGMEEHVPGLEAVLVLDCGHFVTVERPAELSQAMMWFFHRMLASGSPLFHRSRAYGLPTRPVQGASAWGVNPARLDKAALKAEGEAERKAFEAVNK